MNRLFAAFILGVVLTAWTVVPAPNPIPACEEDAVLVGTGTFDGSRWDGYECGPAVDDYTH